MPRSTHAASSPLGEPTAAEVVEPRALARRRAARAGGCAVLAHSRPSRSWSSARARSATCSGVNPSSASTRSPGGRRAEALDGDRVVRPPVPAEGHAGLDGQGGHLGREDLVLHVVGLLLEQLPAGERRHLGVDALGREQLGGGDRDVHLAAGGHQHEVGVFGGAQHVRAAGQAHPRGALEHRQVLPREDERGGPVVLDGEAPRLGRLVGVGGPDHPEPGDGAQRGDVLDRLVGGAVLADARPSRG